MKIEYNEISKEFELTPTDPRLMGPVKLEYKGCCGADPTRDLDAPVQYTATVFKSYTSGSVNITSVTVNGTVYTCTNTGTCLGTNDALLNLDTQYPGAEVMYYDMTDRYKWEFKGVPLVSTITYNMTKGCAIQPLMEKVTPVYSTGIAYSEGVHYFRMYKLIQDNTQNIVVSEEGLYLGDTELLKVLPQHVATHPDTKAHLIYETIKHGLSCTCNFTDICYLYKALAIELNFIDKCKAC